MIHIIQQSCLEKIKINARHFKEPYLSASAMTGEDFAFQIALFSDAERGETVSFCVECQTELKLYEVKQVPVDWPHYADDPYKNYLCDTQCLLPDALVPINRRKTMKIGKNVTVLWVQVAADFPGDYEINFLFDTDNGEITSRFVLHVIGYRMAEQRIEHCEYIDPAAISAAYGKPMFTDKHWELLESYFEIAGKHSVNNLLTPIYPPVYGDHLIGNESVQLVKIIETNKGYEFNYDLLDCWVMFAKRHKIKKLTFPPLVPSLETLRCPRFMVTRNRREELLFGNETNILSLEYFRFIRKYIRALMQHMKEIDAEYMMCFEIAHRPTVQYAENYSRCRAIFSDIIKKHQIADVDVTLDFQQLNIGSAPFFSLENLKDTFDISMDRYACTDVYSADTISNFLIASPSIRLRGIGVLAYYYHITSFLNLWFNCSFTPNGDRTDVFLNTSNENAFPSGSGYLVYPGLNGPIPSIRLKLLHYAFQDIRALSGMIRYIPYERIQARVKKLLGSELDKIPDNPEKFLAIREEIYNLIDKK